MGAHKPVQFVSQGEKWWARALTPVFKQLVSRFFFVRDQTDVFLRTVIQARLHDYLSDFVVSSVSFGAGPLSPYLREVVTSVRLLKARFSYEYLCDVTKKRLYSDILDVFYHYRFTELPTG